MKSSKELDKISLCNKCNKLKNHKGSCDQFSKDSFTFLNSKDFDKVSKSGYATPRGGDKGGYQNHVYRTGKVIIPYEKFKNINPNIYKGGWVVRLFVNQAFDENKRLHVIKNKFVDLVIGKNCFVLYRSYEELSNFPPLRNWSIREHFSKDNKKSKTRTFDGYDKGHYILRTPAQGGSTKVTKLKRYEGIAQGFFAPEYSTSEFDYLVRLQLVYLIMQSENNPYKPEHGLHIKKILKKYNCLDIEKFKYYSAIDSNKKLTCPLCLKKIKYEDLHRTADYSDNSHSENAVTQNVYTTRSTQVNVFHMRPLVYGSVEHKPYQVFWGHHHCNTNLGQNRCFSLEEIKQFKKDGKIKNEKIFADNSQKSIRDEKGNYYIKIT